MTDLTYTFVGANTDRLANSINNLRSNSASFRDIEARIGGNNFSNVVVVMGPDVTPPNLLGTRIPGAGGISADDPSTYYVYLNTTSVGITTVGGRTYALSVDQALVHELDHPAQSRGGGGPFGAPTAISEAEERRVISDTNQVSAEMGWTPNTGFPRFDPARPAICDSSDVNGTNDHILRFADGSAADTGRYIENIPPISERCSE